ncbi:MAG: DUF4440 domain-containing protein [Bacteroidia bacterium]|nr:DUF4440 domain-containing protein [Bacteroidia bacterium]
MKTFLISLLLFINGAVLAQSENIPETISSLMKEQENDWNNFNIDGFMKHYWNNDSLKFIGSKGITYGWKQTLANYKKNYSDKEKMGKLFFTNHLIEVIDNNNAIVCGNWKIKRKDSEIGGNYTLLWKKVNGKWVIVVDHTG